MRSVLFSGPSINHFKVLFNFINFSFHLISFCFRFLFTSLVSQLGNALVVQRCVCVIFQLQLIDFLCALVGSFPEEFVAL